MRKRLFIEQTAPVFGDVIPRVAYIRMCVGGGRSDVEALGVALQRAAQAPPSTFLPSFPAWGEQLHAGAENIIQANGVWLRAANWEHLSGLCCLVHGLVFNVMKLLA